MPQGLEIYDENGVLVSSTNHRWVRFLGSAIIPKPTSNETTWTGVISNPSLASGSLVFYMSGTQTSYSIYPNITIENATTFRWTYNFDNIGGTAIYDPRVLDSINIRYGVI